MASFTWRFSPGSAWSLRRHFRTSPCACWTIILPMCCFLGGVYDIIGGWVGVRLVWNIHRKLRVYKCNYTHILIKSTVTHPRPAGTWNGCRRRARGPRPASGRGRRRGRAYVEGGMDGGKDGDFFGCRACVVWCETSFSRGRLVCIHTLPRPPIPPNTQPTHAPQLLAPLRRLLRRQELL